MLKTTQNEDFLIASRISYIWMLFSLHSKNCSHCRPRSPQKYF